MVYLEGLFTGVAVCSLVDKAPLWVTLLFLALSFVAFMLQSWEN